MEPNAGRVLADLEALRDVPRGPVLKKAPLQQLGIGRWQAIQNLGGRETCQQPGLVSWVNGGNGSALLEDLGSAPFSPSSVRRQPLEIPKAIPEPIPGRLVRRAQKACVQLLNQVLGIWPGKAEALSVGQ